jgi:hypothetical protein
LKSSSCFTSFIDLLTPGKEKLSTCTPEIREFLHSAVFDTISKIAFRYNGKVIYRFEESFVCYFPLTTDIKNRKALEDALNCSIEQERAIGPLSFNIMKHSHYQISRVFYRICANYETLNFKTNLAEANTSVCYPHIDKICSIAPSWSILLGDSVYKRASTFTELKDKFHFRKIGEYKIDSIDQNLYGIYILQ